MRRHATIAAAALLILTGCGAKHYAVKDLGSGTTYYTTRVNQKKGVTTLHDPRTGAKITIHDPEVREISKKEYREGLKDIGPVEHGTSR